MFARSGKSTTVRTIRGRPPRALRAALRAVEALSPALAERLAERLFMTPPRHPPPRWEQAALPGGEPFAVAAAGLRVRGARFGEGPAVLLVHGWGGRGSQLAAFVPPLLDAGCAVVAFDAPGHGASGGRTSNLVRFAEAAVAVGRRFGARAAVAHSLGGAALALALNRGLALDAAVLLAPATTPESFLAPFCAALGLGDGTRDGLRRRIERNVGVRMAELHVPRLAAALEVPALVVHDRADVEVPVAEGAAVAAAWPRARFLETDGLGHRRILRAGAVVRAAASFVLEHLPRCDCGRLAVARARGAPRCHTCHLAAYLADREGRAARASGT